MQQRETYSGEPDAEIYNTVNFSNKNTVDASKSKVDITADSIQNSDFKLLPNLSKIPTNQHLNLSEIQFED